MFRLVNVTKRKELGLVEKVNFIKISPTTGCYITATPEEAIGVAYNCVPYNYRDHKEIEGADTISVMEVDSGYTLFNVSEKEKSLEKQLAETDEAAIELYEANMMLEIANAEQDEAIIEIYEMMGEITNG